MYVEVLLVISIFVPIVMVFTNQKLAVLSIFLGGILSVLLLVLFFYRLAQYNVFSEYIGFLSVGMLTFTLTCIVVFYFGLAFRLFTTCYQFSGKKVLVNIIKPTLWNWLLFMVIVTFVIWVLGFRSILFTETLYKIQAKAPFDCATRSGHLLCRSYSTTLKENLIDANSRITTSIADKLKTRIIKDVDEMNKAGVQGKEAVLERLFNKTSPVIPMTYWDLAGIKPPIKECSWYRYIYKLGECVERKVQVITNELYNRLYIELKSSTVSLLTQAEQGGIKKTETLGVFIIDNADEKANFIRVLGNEVLDVIFVILDILAVISYYFIFLVAGKSLSYIAFRFIFDQDRNQTPLIRDDASLFENQSDPITASVMTPSKIESPGTFTHLLEDQKWYAFWGQGVTTPKPGDFAMLKAKHRPLILGITRWLFNQSFSTDHNRKVFSGKGSGTDEFVLVELSIEQCLAFDPEFLIAYSHGTTINKRFVLGLYPFIFGKYRYVTASGPGKIILLAQNRTARVMPPDDIEAVSVSKILAFEWNKGLSIEVNNRGLAVFSTSPTVSPHSEGLLVSHSPKAPSSAYVVVNLFKRLLYMLFPI